MLLEIYVYPTVTALHFTDQNCIFKPVYCIRCVMVCKISFTRTKAKRFAFQANTKIALLCAYMVVTYYIKLFRTGGERHNGALCLFFL